MQNSGSFFCELEGLPPSGSVCWSVNQVKSTRLNSRTPFTCNVPQSTARRSLPADHNHRELWGSGARGSRGGSMDRRTVKQTRGWGENWVRKLEEKEKEQSSFQGMGTSVPFFSTINVTETIWPMSCFQDFQKPNNGWYIYIRKKKRKNRRDTLRVASLKIKNTRMWQITYICI